MQEERGRRLGRLGTDWGDHLRGGFTLSGEDEERSPTKGDAQGVLLTPFTFKRICHRVAGNKGRRKKMGPKRLLSAPEQDAARGEGELAARGTSPAQALPVTSFLPHP